MMNFAASTHREVRHGSRCTAAHPNLSRDRSLAFSASISRSRAGAWVCSDVSRRRADCVTSATARSKASALACEGLLKPDSLRTNCSAEAWISSSVAGGSKLNSVLMLRHMTFSLPSARTASLNSGLPEFSQIDCPSRQQPTWMAALPRTIHCYKILHLTNGFIIECVSPPPPPISEFPMSHVTYRIVQHDGGWAYTVDGVFSESFATHGAALAAAKRAAAEQRVPGRTEAIEYETSDGKWNT